MKKLNVIWFSDEEIKATLEEYRIWLTVDEIKKLSKLLWRDLTLAEGIIWANQGSEHSSYKSTKKLLKLLPTTWEHVVLGPSEDSWIIALDKEYWIVVSHESHNSPSQIVPYEWAATWVWWIIRDIICMWSKAIWILDCLRFGPLSNDKSRLIYKGCVKWISGYGNPIGVPNLGWDIYFDKGFTDMCLVNVFALWIIKSSDIIHSFAPDEAWEVGYDYILVGKATDNSWFGWAAFSSQIIDESKVSENKWAVQEPNPFLERHIMASSYDLFDWLKQTNNLWKVGFKDLGAWWIVCGTVELVADKGFWGIIDIDLVHTSMNISPEIIACSETQERFIWVCHPSLTQHILDHYNVKWDMPWVSSGAMASKIGKVTKWGQFIIKHKWENICDAKAKDITEGLLIDRPRKKYEKNLIEPNFTIDLKTAIELLIHSPNTASRKPIYEQYDKSVQWNTYMEESEACAAIIRPTSWNIWVAATQTWSWRYGLIDPYFQSYNACARACLKLAAVGARPRCLTDCLNYGNPEFENDMHDFEQGVLWIKYFCENLNIPIISWNVSLYKKVPPSAIIWGIWVIENVINSRWKKLKSSDSLLVLIWKQNWKLAGTELYRLNELLWANLPEIDIDDTKNMINWLLDCKAISASVVLEWWPLIAVINMMMKNDKDEEMNIWASLTWWVSELCTEDLWVVIEINKEDLEATMLKFKNARIIWKTHKDRCLRIEDIEISLDSIYNTWANTLYG